MTIILPLIDSSSLVRRRGVNRSIVTLWLEVHEWVTCNHWDSSSNEPLSEFVEVPSSLHLRGEFRDWDVVAVHEAFLLQEIGHLHLQLLDRIRERSRLRIPVQ